MAFIKYWYTPKFVQQFIQLIAPKADTFECVVTKDWTGNWVFNKWLIKDEPFCNGSDAVISTIYCNKTYTVAQDGDKAIVKVSTIEPAEYDTCFSNPVPTTNGHYYTCSATGISAFVCDVAQVFFKGVPEKFFITVEPIT